MSQFRERAETPASRDAGASREPIMGTSTTFQGGAPRDRSRRGNQRGREAETPGEVPKRGWLDILTRTKNEIAQDNLSIVAAGVAFYCFLAFVPALGAVIGVYAWVSDPAQVSSHLESFAQMMPREIMPILREQMTRLASENEAAGISAVLSVLLAVYGSSKAATALIEGLNIAYDEEEKRGFFKLQGVALLLTLMAVVGAVVAVGLVAVLPAVLQVLHLGPATEIVVSLARWPILVGGFMFALAVLYRYAPCRDEPRWSWVSWGAAAAAALWVLGSAVFSLYVSSFGSYDKTYGSLAGLVVFLFWLFLTAYVVLFGAELNSEMERQTRKDTTEGPPKPLGARGAYSADTVGPARGAEKG